MKSRKMNSLKDGKSGKLKFNIIYSELGEHCNTLQFLHLPRSPIFNFKKKQFRRSFSLSVDYDLINPLNKRIATI